MKKMSEVFDLPLAADEHGSVFDKYAEEVGCMNYAQDASNIAHAISCHDELVEMLERINCCIGWGYSDSELAVEIKVYASEIESLLKKARGEA